MAIKFSPGCGCCGCDLFVSEFGASGNWATNWQHIAADAMDSVASSGVSLTDDEYLVSSPVTETDWQIDFASIGDFCQNVGDKLIIEIIDSAADIRTSTTKAKFILEGDNTSTGLAAQIKVTATIGGSSPTPAVLYYSTEVSAGTGSAFAVAVRPDGLMFSITGTMYTSISALTADDYEDGVAWDLGSAVGSVRVRVSVVSDTLTLDTISAAKILIEEYTGGSGATAYDPATTANADCDDPRLCTLIKPYRHQDWSVTSWDFGTIGETATDLVVYDGCGAVVLDNDLTDPPTRTSISVEYISLDGPCTFTGSPVSNTYDNDVDCRVAVVAAEHGSDSSKVVLTITAQWTFLDADEETSVDLTSTGDTATTDTTTSVEDAESWSSTYANGSATGPGYPDETYQDFWVNFPTNSSRSPGTPSGNIESVLQIVWTETVTRWSNGNEPTISLSGADADSATVSGGAVDFVRRLKTLEHEHTPTGTDNDFDWDRTATWEIVTVDNITLDIN